MAKHGDGEKLSSTIELALRALETMPGEGGLYPIRTVAILGMLQFLLGNIGMQAVLRYVKQRQLDVLGDCRRKERKRGASTNSGGLCQARRKLTPDEAYKAAGLIYAKFNNDEYLWNGRTVLAIDGTELALEPVANLRSEYASRKNQNGSSVFPEVRVLVAHNLITGAALEPEVGTIHDAEDWLFRRLLARHAVPGGVMVGDSNFGIFRVAHPIREAGMDAVLAVTHDREIAMFKGELSIGTDQPFTWRPSAYEINKHKICADAQVDGRVIATTIRWSGKRERVLLFTTLRNVPVAEIAALYRRRWEIETDLRNLKRLLNLERLRVRTANQVVPQIILAVSAYNLIRLNILLAARKHKIADPKRISFKAATQLTEGMIQILGDPSLSFEERMRRYELTLDILAQSLNPRRKGRQYPRKQYKRRANYPIRGTALDEN